MKSPMTWLNRLLVALLLAGLVAYLPAELDRMRAPGDLERVNRERDELQAGNARLREQIRLVEAEVSALHADVRIPGSRDLMLREVERIAREDLNMVRPGEVVFEFSAEVGAAREERQP